jgi:limonene-1,2-epoxide hydrolase
MSAHLDTVRTFFAAWARQDHTAVLELLHEEVVYQNMPFAEVLRGRPEIAKFMAKFGRGMEDIRVDLRHLIASGDVVFHEGTENYIRKGRPVSLPYAGVFEFKDGKIIGWRDYFDYASLERQLAAPNQKAPA